MIMVALILLIDAIAILLYRTMGIEEATQDRRMVFGGAWTLVSLAVVLSGLYRIRTARNMRARTRR